MVDSAPPPGALDCLASLKRRYQVAGFRGSGAVPAAGLLGDLGAAGLERALAFLLDAGAAVPAGQNAVALTEILRLQLLDEEVLRGWVDRVALSIEEAEREQVVLACRTELQLLVNYAVRAPRTGAQALAPADYERAAGLAGVLVLPELRPEACHTVVAHGGTGEAKLRWLAAQPPACFRSLEQLQAGLVTHISTQIATPRRG